VRAGNADGWSAHSTWLNFTVSAPIAPTPQSPNSVVPNGNPTFTWTKPVGATKYALYVSTNATPSVVKLAKNITVTCGTTTCSYTPTALNLTAGRYKWNVRAGNTADWSAHSTWLNFSASAPSAPTPQLPNSIVPSSNPTFTWTKPDGATKYSLYVSTNATPSVEKFANYITATCGTTTCSYTPTLNLTASSYKWNVRAGNSFGWSSHSTWLNFNYVPASTVLPIVIILTWKANPPDLDSHLWLPSTTPYHVNWPVSSQGSDTSFPYAYLDRDDTNGYGPEKIVIKRYYAGIYTYAVNCYKCSNLKASGASVRVYRGENLIYTFSVANASGSDPSSWWTVFEINGNNGGITGRNTLNSTPLALLMGESTNGLTK